MNYARLRIVLLIIFFGFGLWLQIATFTSGDVLWLVNVADRLLAGGKYYYDFIEVNTPMSVYIYLPAVCLSRLLKLNVIFTTNLYLFILISSSWLFCSYVLKRLFNDKAYFIRYSLELAIAFIYFVLPTFDFGEREHLLIVLIMPYLLIVACRIDHLFIKPATGCLAGIMAGLGFALKPFFIPFWLAIELYVLIKNKSFKILIRPEWLSCVSIFLLYGISILLFTPEYITKLIPLILPFYYPYYTYPFLVLLTQKVTYFSLVLLGLTFILRRKSNNKTLIDLLIISLFSTLFIYLIQRTIWNYHMLPIFMIDSILLSLLLAEFLPQYNLFKAKEIDVHFLKTSFITACSLGLLVSLTSFICKCIETSFIANDTIFKNQLYALAKSTNGQPIYIFTDSILVNYPMLNYANIISPSHFPCLWLLSAAQKIRETDPTPAKQAMANNVANFVRSTEIAALIKSKPIYIVIQKYSLQLVSKNINLLQNSYTIRNVPSANHFNFFLQDPQFAKFWQNYRYVEDLDGYTVYKRVY